MKNKFLKRTLSTILTAVMLLSIIATGIVSTSALGYGTDTYTFKFYTAGGKGPTSQGISIYVSGHYGNSSIMTLPDCGKTKGVYTCTVDGDYVGPRINCFKVKTNSTTDDWFLEKVEITSAINNKTQTFYCGDWVNKNLQLFGDTEPVYKVTIKTANEKYAGTNAEVCAYITSNKSTSTGYDLNDVCSGDAFEKGNVQEFYFNLGYDTNTFENINFTLYDNTSDFISYVDSNTASAWKLEYVKIEQLQGYVEDEDCIFYANQWIDINEHVTLGKESGTSNVFKTEIKTSNKKNAGTDADISIQLTGTNGTSQLTSIDHFVDDYTDNINNFEKNDTDSFQFIAKDGNYLGELKSIRIKNRGNGVGPGWHVDYIKLTEITADGKEAKTYTFKINDWIDANEEYTCNKVTVS